MDDGFAYCKARSPKDPRVLSDARNYMDKLVEYGQKQHDAAVQIDVELDGRSVTFGLPRAGPGSAPKVVEHVTFEALSEKGILPKVPRGPE